jgi:hypothetical protein
MSRKLLVATLAIVAALAVALFGAESRSGNESACDDESPPSECSELALTPGTSTPSTNREAAGSVIGVASLDAQAEPSAASGGWSATLSVTVTDEHDVVVAGAVVTGVWSDGASSASCTTGDTGTCSFTSQHEAITAAREVTWKLSSVTKPGATMAEGSTATARCTSPDVGAPRCTVEATL